MDKTVWNRLLFAWACGLPLLAVLPYGTVHPPVVALFYILLAVGAAMAAADSFSSGELRVSRSAVQLPLLLTSVYAFVQVLPLGSEATVAGVDAIPWTISRDPFWTLVFALHMLGLMIFLSLALTAFDSVRRLYRAAAVITVFGFLYSFFAIIQSFLSPDKIYGIYEVSFATPFGSFVNRHNFAAVIEMCIAIPLGLLLQGSVHKDKRLLLVTTVVLMAIALLMSGSRGGMVALGAQIVMLLILSRGTFLGGRVWMKAALGVFLIVGVVIGAAYIGSETSMSRISETARSEDFTSKRTEIWGSTVRLIQENPVLGSGFGAFGVAYAKFDAGNGLERVEQAHNDYLQVLADGGIIGAAIGLFFIVSLFRSGFRSPSIESGLRRGIAVGAFVGIFGVLVHSLFDFVLHTTAVSAIFLLLVAVLKCAEQPMPDDAPDVPPASRRGSPDNVKNIGDGRKATQADG